MAIIKDVINMNNIYKLNNPNLSAKKIRSIIDQLRYKDDDEVRTFDLLAVAGHPNCPYDVLDELLIFDREEVNLSVAKHPNCSKVTLLKLVHCGKRKVVATAIANDNFPVKEFDKLIESKDELIIEEIIKSDKCTTKTIDKILPGISIINAISLANNQKTNPDQLVQLLELNNDDVMEAIVKRSDCPLEALKKLVYCERDDIRELAIMHQNTTIELLNEVVDKYDFYRNRVACITKNPNCTSELLEKLYDKITNVEDEISIIENQVCPSGVLEKVYLNLRENYSHNNRFLLRDYDKEKRRIIAKHTNCPLNIIKSLVKSSDMDTREFAYNNPNCPIELVLNDEKYDALVNRFKDDIIPNIYCYYLIDKLYKELNRNPYTAKRIIECLINTLISDECDDYVIDYLIDNSHYSQLKIDNWRLLDKIEQRKIKRKQSNEQLNWKFNIKNENGTKRKKLSGVYFELVDRIKLFDVKPFFDTINYMGPELFYYETSTYSLTDYSNSFVNGTALKIKIKVDEKTNMLLKDKMKVSTIEFGEFPRDALTEIECWILEKALEMGLLQKTGKEYMFGSDKVYYEYMIDGKKFVKKRNQWYLVKPIRWFYDEEKRLLETQESIYGYMEMPQGKSLDNEMNLSVYSSIMSIGLKEYDIRQEEKQNAIDMYNDAERLRKSKEEKERVNRELKQKQEEEQKRNLEKDKELEEIEKQNLEDLDIIASAVERINERNNRAISLGVSPISVNRVHIDDELLLIKIEEYVMFNPAYVKLLRYIDLSSISSEKLVASNIDFRGTNIVINPQLVYNKDLSDSLFDDNNINGSFEGVNLKGADISDEKWPVGIELAIIDEYTKLPQGLLNNQMAV